MWNNRKDLIKCVYIQLSDLNIVITNTNLCSITGNRRRKSQRQAKFALRRFANDSSNPVEVGNSDDENQNNEDKSEQHDRSSYQRDQS